MEHNNSLVTHEHMVLKRRRLGNQRNVPSNG